MNEYLEILPMEIIKKGVKIRNGIGLAFYSSEILKISQILLAENIIVLGGDVLVKNKDGLADYSRGGESWYVEDGEAKSVTSSNKKMLSYVNSLSKKHPEFLYSAIVLKQDKNDNS